MTGAGAGTRSAVRLGSGSRPIGDGDSSSPSTPAARPMIRATVPGGTRGASADGTRGADCCGGFTRSPSMISRRFARSAAFCWSMIFCSRSRSAFVSRPDGGREPGVGAGPLVFGSRPGFGSGVRGGAVVGGAVGAGAVGPGAVGTGSDGAGAGPGVGIDGAGGAGWVGAMLRVGAICANSPP